MVTCELDNEISGEILGLKLPAWKAILFHRVLPSCGGLIVYLTLMCFDLALIVEHFQNGDDGYVIESIVHLQCITLVVLMSNFILSAHRKIYLFISFFIECSS